MCPTAWSVHVKDCASKVQGEQAGPIHHAAEAPNCRSAAGTLRVARNESSPGVDVVPWPSTESGWKAGWPGIHRGACRTLPSRRTYLAKAHGQ